jgi:multicomponent Na+:H+ antiporter subunit D
LLLAVLVLGLIPGAVPEVERYSAQFVDHHAYAAWVLHGGRFPLPILPPSHISGADYAYSVASVLGAMLVAAYGWWGERAVNARGFLRVHPVRHTVDAIRRLHSGHIGDYIAWWSAGVSLIGGVCLVALR